MTGGQFEFKDIKTIKQTYESLAQAVLEGEDPDVRDLLVSVLRGGFYAGSMSMMKRLQYVLTLNTEMQEHYLTELTKELDEYKKELGQ